MSTARASDIPADWPSIEQPSRRRVLCWRAAAMIIVAYTVVDVVLSGDSYVDRLWWARTLELVGVVLLTGAALSAWRLAVQPRRLFLFRESPALPTAEMRKPVRRALLRGDPVQTGSLRTVAMLAAAETRTPSSALVAVIVVGNGALTTSTSSTVATSWIGLGGLIFAVSAVPLMTVAVVQSSRIRRAAAAVGAAPITKLPALSPETAP